MELTNDVSQEIILRIIRLIFQKEKPGKFCLVMLNRNIVVESKKTRKLVTISQRIYSDLPFIQFNY